MKKNITQIILIVLAANHITLASAEDDNFPIWVGAGLPAVYPVETETFLPIKINGKSFLVRPNGALVTECMKNLEKPMSYSYPSTSTYLHTVPITSNGSMMGNWETELSEALASSSAQSQREVMGALNGQTEGMAQLINGQHWTAVPVGFSYRVIAQGYAAGMLRERGKETGVAILAKTVGLATIHFVVLSQSCSNALNQVRARLFDIRNAIATDPNIRRIEVTSEEIIKQLPLEDRSMVPSGQTYPINTRGKTIPVNAETLKNVLAPKPPKGQ